MTEENQTEPVIETPLEKARKAHAERRRELMANALAGAFEDERIPPIIAAGKRTVWPSLAPLTREEAMLVHGLAYDMIQKMKGEAQG